MKPNFALDLSHEGINLLHRGKAGWTLVGSVALDDPDMGARLDDLRRSAAMLESGGFTTKLIIPNSQILYTTVDAAGPDDIAREVQIRAALDGLTPYAVGDLVFDWRAEGDRARVAVLARETMDEAEAFASEYKFNPVSFVARPGRGEFSGEPFFGKTRAATRLLPPGARLEPDTSPLPSKPRALELSAEARVDSPAGEADAAPAPETETPQPSATPTKPAEAPDHVESATPPPDGTPALPPQDTAPDTAPVAPPKRKPRAERGDVGRVSAPALAPFPPTPDELAATPKVPPRSIAPVSRTAKVPRSTGPKLEAPARPRPESTDKPPTPTAEAPESAASAPRANGPDTSDNTKPDLAPPVSDPAPAAFHSRRAGAAGSAKEGAPPSEHPEGTPLQDGIGAAADTSPATKSEEPAGSTESTPEEPPRKVLPPPAVSPPVVRAHADMADALSRPLPSADQPSEPASAKGNIFSGLLGTARGVTEQAGNGLKSAARTVKSRAEARRASRSEADGDTAAEPQTKTSAAGEKEDAVRPPRKGLATIIGKRKSQERSEIESRRAREAEALTVFGARKSQDTRGRPKYLGLILTLLLLLAMAVLAVWSSYVIDDDVALFNPEPGNITSPASPPSAPDQPDDATATLADPPADSSAVLSPEAAAARYAATGIWQRAPEPLGEPETTRLSTRDLAGLTPAMTDRAPLPVPGELSGASRDALLATPVPPPPPGTSFDLDENGLVRPTPEGALSPTGILVFSGPPERVPPARPGDLPDVAPPFALPDVPNIRPRPRPADFVPPANPIAPPDVPAPGTAAEEAPQTAPETETPPEAAPEIDGEDNAELAPTDDEADASSETALAAVPRPEPRPDDLVVSTASASAAIDAAVSDAIAAALVNPTELAVATSRKPSERPTNFAAIIDSAREAASDGSRVAAAAAATPAVAAAASVAPAIPTSASVATQATVKNAINLREINLVGIYGTSSARRALVRMKNGRYVKVEVGDKLDGGRVTSITATELTYQKGNRAYKLGVLPLG